jgi:hypothetical protein
LPAHHAAHHAAPTIATIAPHSHSINAHVHKWPTTWEIAIFMDNQDPNDVYCHFCSCFIVKLTIFIYVLGSDYLVKTVINPQHTDHRDGDLVMMQHCKDKDKNKNKNTGMDHHKKTMRAWHQ